MRLFGNPIERRNAMLNLIHDCRELERRLVSLRRHKEEMQNEISDCEKSLSLLLFKIEELRGVEVRPDDALTLQAYRIIERWLEWARLHGHLDHAKGIVKDSCELIANGKAQASKSMSRSARLS